MSGSEGPDEQDEGLVESRSKWYLWGPRTRKGRGVTVGTDVRSSGGVVVDPELLGSVMYFWVLGSKVWSGTTIFEVPEGPVPFKHTGIREWMPHWEVRVGPWSTLDYRGGRYLHRVGVGSG